MTHSEAPCDKPIEGYKEARPVVFSSMYPMASDDYEDLSAALEKLSLNDPSLVYEKDASAALGFGYRCGFLGLLHLDVIQERLQREFDMSLILTAPSVLYKITLKSGEDIEVDNPSNWPDPMHIASVQEPYIKASILVPERYMGVVMDLCSQHRAESLSMNYLAVGRVEVVSLMPLGEVLFDYYDKLKTITQGYGSFDWAPEEYRASKIVKVEVLVNKERVDALAYLIDLGILRFDVPLSCRMH